MGTLLDKILNQPILLSIVITILCIPIYFLLMQMAKKLIQKSRIDLNFHQFLLSLFKIILWLFFATLIVSKFFSIELTTLLAAFGVVGLAISLAIKDSLSNLASGALLLLNKSFTIDHYISIDKVEGYVLEVGLIYTKLYTVDGQIVYIPNNIMTKQILINYTEHKIRRLDLTFSVDNIEEIEQIKTILLTCMGENTLSEKKPEPTIQLGKRYQDKQEITLFTWCLEENYFLLEHALSESIKKALEKEKITIVEEKITTH